MAEPLIRPGRPVEYRARDAESLMRAMRALIPAKLPEWTDHTSEADFGNVLLELFAHVGDILGYYIDAAANESFLGTAQTRCGVIDHLRLIGYRLATAAPAAAELTLTVPDSESFTGGVVIEPGDAFATGGGPGAPSVRFEFAQRDPLVIDRARFADAGGGVLRAEVAIPVEEGRLVPGEVLGVSDGTAYQRFPLVHHGLILRSRGASQVLTPDLEVESGRGDDRIRWTLRETLAFSGPGEADVIVEIDAEDRAEIVFGEAVPDPGEQVRATYRVGGGPHGNVGAGMIRNIVDAPALSVIGAQVTNPAPATGGAARETIEHAVRHAPKAFRSMRRAVTMGDYEALAAEFGGVGKVRAEAGNWNTVVLYVAPQGGGAVSDVLVGNLIAYFEDLRPVNTRIEIESARYVPVFVTAEVDVDAHHSLHRTTEQVRQAVRAVLAFDAVEFGGVLYLSKLYEAIEAVTGVMGANISEFRIPGGDKAVQPQGKLVMGARELPRVPAGPDDFDEHPLGADPADYPEGVRVLASGGFA